MGDRFTECEVSNAWTDVADGFDGRQGGYGNKIYGQLLYHFLAQVDRQHQKQSIGILFLIPPGPCY
jgi:hypothetical protein